MATSWKAAVIHHSAVAISWKKLGISAFRRNVDDDLFSRHALANIYINDLAATLALAVAISGELRRAYGSSYAGAIISLPAHTNLTERNFLKCHWSCNALFGLSYIKILWSFHLAPSAVSYLITLIRVREMKAWHWRQLSGRAHGH